MRTRYIVMMAAGVLILAAVLVYKTGEEIVISKDISRVGRKDSGRKQMWMYRKNDIKEVK